jgi:ectoine hydroxylase-related dioxygenase (phytanoyl-CoA dioxygenase family)
VEPEKVLAHSPRILTQEQREFYFDQGYLVLEQIVPQAWIDRLNAVTGEFVERSRAVARSDATFDLEPGHTSENPRLRRLMNPVEQHPRYWEFASESLLGDIAADLVGPNVKFHHSNLNFKWAAGGTEVKWHQDIQYWPHTNYSPLTMGVYLHDVGLAQAPLRVLPGSHKGELFSLYDGAGTWAGCLSSSDVERLDVDAAVDLVGLAGSVTVHNCRAVHSSLRNESDLGRPLLLNIFTAADAFAYTANPFPSRYAGTIIRGSAARWAHHDPRPCLIPPDWSAGYTPLFASQQEERRDAGHQEKMKQRPNLMRPAVRSNLMRSAVESKPGRVMY